MDAKGRPVYPRFYQELVEVPGEDSKLLESTYARMRKGRAALEGLLKKAQGRELGELGDLTDKIEEAKGGLDSAMMDFEGPMFAKYGGSLEAALGECAEKGFGIPRPAMNFTCGADGKVVFYEIQSIVDYKKIAEAVGGIEDEDLRRYAGGVLGETLVLEDRALSKILAWVEAGAVGRDSDYSRLPGSNYGLIPFPLHNIGREFVFDDGTMVARWQAGTRSVMRRLGDLFPQIPEASPPKTKKALVFTPDLRGSHERQLERLRQRTK
jgi:hypothetical protein